MFMTNLDIHSRINDFTKEDMRLAKVLEGLGIDTCCGGNKSLAEACREKGLDPKVVLKELVPSEEPVDSREEEKDWSDADLTDLVTHIEETHHVYLKKVLPQLSALIEKVVKAHGERHPELSDLQKIFALLRADLEPHMMKEERVLFPMIRQIESGAGPEELHCGTQGPINVMRMEHQRAEALQEKLRKITNNFTLPEDGCKTYRLMLEGLENLDADLNVHIYKENEVLFPRVLTTETDSI
ncbi:MAG: iron-sulfur cluster repair di-iron protein [Nitrospinae bacterium]|jgi:regulator of cell morphogenesis and NO signaling|nr:iron-sulfur cluster repair di-iron protein [Nitrospinota bacterium]